jgi:hypothetical protein
MLHSPRSFARTCAGRAGHEDVRSRRGGRCSSSRRGGSSGGHCKSIRVCYRETAVFAAMECDGSQVRSQSNARRHSETGARALESGTRSAGVHSAQECGRILHSVVRVYHALVLSRGRCTPRAHTHTARRECAGGRAEDSGPSGSILEWGRGRAISINRFASLQWNSPHFIGCVWTWSVCGLGIVLPVRSEVGRLGRRVS